MRFKNLFPLILSLMTFATYGQTEKNQTPEITSAVTGLKIETEEIQDINWNEIMAVFEDNDPDQEITFDFKYVSNSTVDKKKIRVDNISFSMTVKTSELGDLAERLENSLGKFAQIDGRDIN